MKIDDLHQADFREMQRLSSKGNFHIEYYAIMGTGLDAYLKKFIVFWQTNQTLVNWEIFIALILEAQTLLIRNMTIFHLITPHDLSQWNVDKTFKENLIGNFMVANKVETQFAYSISYARQVA